MTRQRTSIVAAAFSCSLALLLALSAVEANAEAYAAASGSGSTSSAAGETKLSFHIVKHKKGLAQGSANVRITGEDEAYHVKVALDCLWIGEVENGHSAIISGVVVASDAPDEYGYAEGNTVRFISWDTGEGDGQSDVDGLTPLYSMGEFVADACQPDLLLLAFADSYKFSGGNIQISL
jgi:hypothetical protein